MVFALMVVTYPEVNRGSPCREIIDTFNDFIAMVDFTEHWLGRKYIEDRSEPDDTQAPGWDYVEVEP